MADEPELTPGAEGEWVQYLQQWLNSLGFYQGAVDAQFGPVTEQAVTAAQQHYSINEGGAVGQETWHLITIARTGSDAQAEVVWTDSQLNEVDVPEIGAEDEGGVWA